MGRTQIEFVIYNPKEDGFLRFRGFDTDHHEDDQASLLVYWADSHESKNTFLSVSDFIRTIREEMLIPDNLLYPNKECTIYDIDEIREWVVVPKEMMEGGAHRSEGEMYWNQSFTVGEGIDDG